MTGMVERRTPMNVGAGRYGGGLSGLLTLLTAIPVDPIGLERKADVSGSGRNPPAQRMAQLELSVSSKSLNCRRLCCRNPK